ncbi:MAG: DUF805 domain-containing protein [Chloroflexi bacterium]|nr:DUF805 domain-containing protein [Chloroflexota bacterium]|tara:strand:- start:443 stop:868 length:426 start_codon:yes stop_codon:yes gene_type:complete
MSFVQSVETCLKKYADFSGRASRSEYWWFFLFNILMGAVGSIADIILLGEEVGSTGIIQSLVTLGLLLPGLAVGARRLHDINKSGWWQLLLIASFLIIPAIYLIYLYARPSSNSSFCTSCGTESQADEEAIFCASCGEKTI